MSKLLKLAVESKTSAIPHTLTGAKTPRELLEWMKHNLRYHGVNKQRLFLPKEVIEEKKGHCWETANLAYQELTTLGYRCFLLYLEDVGCHHTHTTVLYEDDGEFYWFEWAWGAMEGIHGPTALLDTQMRQVMERFTLEYRSLQRTRLGHGQIQPGMTEREYIEMTNHWKHIQTIRGMDK